MHRPVEQRPYISDADFRRDFLDQKPLVLTQMTRQWPSLAWSFRSLAERAGDTPVVLKRYVSGEGTDFLSQTSLQRHSTTLGEWLLELDADQADAQWCLRESPTPFHAHPELREECGFRGVFPRGHPHFEHVLWAGPGNYVTGLHTDEVALNLLCHIAGKKRVVIYRPEDEAALYPLTHGTVDGGRYSAVDPVSPDRARHPEFEGVVGSECLLNPGDLLYIPRGHWHWAQALSPCLSVSGLSETA